MGLKQFLWVICEFILSFLAILFFLCVLLPILFLLCIPCLIWRIFVKIIVKCCKPHGYVRILSGQNPVMACDDIYGRPLNTIVGMGAFEGASLDDISQFAIRSMDGKESNGEWSYPEAHQYYEEWLGFFWWKWEENYDAQSHIIRWNSPGDKVSSSEFIQIVAELEARPFAKGRSPWEVVLIAGVMLEGVKNPHIGKTVIMFRFHHGFSDGIAMMHVFMQFVFGDSFEKVASPQYVSRTRVEKRLHKFVSLLQFPYQAMKQGIVATDTNDWHLPENKLSRVIYKAWSPRISTESIKEVKMRLGVGFTAVLVALISGALRNMMIRHGIKVPRKMHAILPLPWPKHPKRFCNHWSYGYLELPVGASEIKNRLNKTNRYVESLKNSAAPLINFYVARGFNVLPTFLIKSLTLTNYFPTVILSNFPGPPSGSEGSGGFPLMDCMFTGGPLRGNIGISICILSYDGHLRIVAGIDSSIFPTQEMTNELIQEIQDELKRMQNEPPTETDTEKTTQV